MTTVSNALESYLLHSKYEKNLSNLTIKAYKQDLNQFQYFTGSNLDIKELDKELIRKFLQYLFQLKLKETSIKRKLASVKVFLRYLEYEDLIQVSPFRKLNIRIKIPRKTPKFLSLHDVKMLFKASKTNCAVSHLYIENKPSECELDKKQFVNFQMLVIIELLFATGIRVSELCNLDVDDVDINKKVIRVLGKGSKERIIPVTHQETLRILETFLKLKRKLDVAFTPLLANRLRKRMQPHSVRLLLCDLSKNAGLTTKITPHMFRHTLATMLIENGIDIRFVQKLLGHSSILTTQIYTHLSTSAQRHTIAKKHPRNNLKMISM